MATLLEARLAPAWHALTPTQRTAWHNFASGNPITNTKGDLIAVNGWQMWVYVNTWLAIPTPPVTIPDPPADLKRPDRFNLAGTTWSIKSKRLAGTTARRGIAVLQITTPIPTARIVFFTQHKLRFQSFFGRTAIARRGHTTYLNAGESGFVNLTVSRGFRDIFGNFGEAQKIFGPFASHHPRVAMARTVIVSTVNGAHVDGTITNSQA